MLPARYEPIMSLCIQFMVIVGVAAMAIGFIRAIFLHHSIPLEDEIRLSKIYGKWAVTRAISDCPENDVACVERRAKALSEVIMLRR